MDNVQIRKYQLDSLDLITRELERLISMTPTSPLRNEITEINIRVLALEEKIRAA